MENRNKKAWYPSAAVPWQCLAAESDPLLNENRQYGIPKPNTLRHPASYPFSLNEENRTA